MTKLKLNENRLGAEHMYKEYKKNNPNTDITYPLYKTVLDLFNKKIADKILEGKSFNMGYKLGSIRIKKIERTPTNKVINWPETQALWEEQGYKKDFVYFTDKYYYRWNWEKRKCTVKNKSVYKFIPTSGKNGLKKKLAFKLKSDPFALINYLK